MVQYKYYCGVSGGRDLIYKDMEDVCAEDIVFGRSVRCHISSVTLQCTSVFSSDTVSNLTMDIRVETCI